MPTRPVPFAAHWELGPMSAGAFEARLKLDDPAPFAGHYPGAPLLPGNLLIESIAQAASAALRGDWRLEEIVSSRFHAPLLPGETVTARLAIADDGASKVVEAKASGRAEAGEIKLRLAPADRALERVEPASEIRPGQTWEQARGEGRPLDPGFIRRALPHRSPMLLIDQAAIAGADTNKPVLIARKAINAQEPCFASAGEGLAAWSYPATLIAESFCQACGLLRAGSAPAGTARDPSRVPVLARLGKLRFVGEASLGEVIEHRVRLTARMPDGAIFSGESVVDGRVVMQVEKVIAAMAPRPG